MRQRAFGANLASAKSTSSTCVRSLGDSCNLGQNSVGSSPYSRALTRAPSKGCSRWSSKATTTASPELPPAGTGTRPGQAATPAVVAPSPPASVPAAVDNTITIDDFLKVELRVGQVKVAEKVKGADK